MAEQFQVGDVVQLKSGGPDMTVTEVDNTSTGLEVYCAWFTGNKEVRGHFPAGSLRKGTAFIS